MCKQKVVSQLIQDIGKIRDLVEEKDYKMLARHEVVMARILQGIKKHYTVYLKDPTHYLDFTSYDLEETSNEITPLLRELQRKVTMKTMQKELLKVGEEAFNEEYCTLFKVRSNLTEMQSAMMYIATCLRLIEEGKAKVVPTKAEARELHAKQISKGKDD